MNKQLGKHSVAIDTISNNKKYATAIDTVANNKKHATAIDAVANNKEYGTAIDTVANNKKYGTAIDAISNNKKCGTNLTNLPPAMSPVSSGKIIVSLGRACTYPNVPLDSEPSVFEGIEIEAMEEIFRPLPNDEEGDVGAIFLISLADKNAQMLKDALDVLNENPCVVLAEPDYLVDSHTLPNDRYFDYLWGLKAIDASQAWDNSVGSDAVSVAIVDSGIDYYHPDIIENLWLAIDETSLNGLQGSVASMNYEQAGQSLGGLRGSVAPLEGIMGAEEYLDGFEPRGISGLSAMDNTGHGTHVAGTIGAVGNNEIGVCGVCWRIRLVSLKIGNAFMDLAAAIKAIDFASRNNIGIVNASWGGFFYSESLEYAIEHYNGLVVASAGNSGSDNDAFPIFPASYQGKNIISVAASTREDVLASFSNYGAASVDIAAPGVDILSTDTLSRYSYMDGTSMSAPHVSGAAALIKSINPSLEPVEIKNVLMLSAEKHPELDGKILSGGVLNINQALQLAKRLSQ